MKKHLSPETLVEATRIQIILNFTLKRFLRSIKASKYLLTVQSQKSPIRNAVILSEHTTV